MAGVRFSVETIGEVATTTSKKTVVQILAPTNQRVLVNEYWCEFKGTSNTAAPILVEIENQSSAGTGGSAVTPVKADLGYAETIQTTALSDISTGTPTAVSVWTRREVHPQGSLNWQAPFGKEIIVKGGGRLGIAVTAGADVSCSAGFICEE